MLMVLQECLRIPYPGWPHTRLETTALSSSCCPDSEGKPEKSRRRRKDVNDIIFRIDFPRETFSGPSRLHEMRRCSIMVLWKERKKTITKFCLRKVIKNNLDFKYEQHFCERIENEIGNFYQFRTLFGFVLLRWVEN